MSSELFRGTATRKNDGAIEATDVNWMIQLDGGALIGSTSEGQGLQVPAGGTATIQSGLILGFGPTTVTTTVEYGENGLDSRTQNGFVLLFLININPSG